MVTTFNGRAIKLNIVSLFQEAGEKLSAIGGRLDYPQLNKELAQEIETLWNDAAIQVIFNSLAGQFIIFFVLFKQVVLLNLVSE